MYTVNYILIVHVNLSYIPNVWQLLKSNVKMFWKSRYILDSWEGGSQCGWRGYVFILDHNWVRIWVRLSTPIEGGEYLEGGMCFFQTWKGGWCFYFKSPLSEDLCWPFYPICCNMNQSFYPIRGIRRMGNS